MKLELKHLAPYLPYQLDFITDNNKMMKLTLTSDDNIIINGGILTLSAVLHGKAKSILRPLSDLTKEIEIDRVKFIPIDFGCNGLDIDLKNLNIELNRNKSMTKYTIISRFEYRTIQKLFEWHFDIFNLIENGLAIDINTLK